MQNQSYKLFGTSGIRSIVDEQFIDLMYRVGLAIGAKYKRVLVGRDTRSTGEQTRDAFCRRLLSKGAEFTDCGVVPTSTLAIAGKEYDASAMITASHNPTAYNGIKLLNHSCIAFDDKQQSCIEKYVKGISVGRGEGKISQCRKR